VYSTSLVVFALTNCEEVDFTNAEVNSKRLLNNGVNFLLTKKHIIDPNKYAWSLVNHLKAINPKIGWGRRKITLILLLLLFFIGTYFTDKLYGCAK